MVDFKVFATESPASIQPCAIIPPTTITTNQGRMDSPWTPGPVLSIVPDPNVTRGEEYCPNPPWHGLRQKPTVSTSDSCFLLFPSSLCSWLFSKILHFQSGEAGWVRKSVWRSKCNGTWESLEFMLMMLFIGTYLDVKLVFFLIENKKWWFCLAADHLSGLKMTFVVMRARVWLFAGRRRRWRLHLLHSGSTCSEKHCPHRAALWRRGNLRLQGRFLLCYK